MTTFQISLTGTKDELKEAVNKNISASKEPGKSAKTAVAVLIDKIPDKHTASLTYTGSIDKNGVVISLSLTT